jgi:hypothetical protein
MMKSAFPLVAVVSAAPVAVVAVVAVPFAAADAAAAVDVAAAVAVGVHVAVCSAGNLIFAGTNFSDSAANR